MSKKKKKQNSSPLFLTDIFVRYKNLGLPTSPFTMIKMPSDYVLICMVPDDKSAFISISSCICSIYFFFCMFLRLFISITLLCLGVYSNWLWCILSWFSLCFFCWVLFSILGLGVNDFKQLIKIITVI